MSTKHYEGGCACGAVRFQLTSEPMFVHCCHCDDCRRLSGGAFGIKAVIETNRVNVLRGTPAEHIVPNRDGRTQTVLRCPDCGVALWGTHPELGEAVVLVYLGALDAGHGLEPQAHCFVHDRLNWVTIPPGVHAAEGYYVLEDCWPPESLKRLDIAMGDQEEVLRDDAPDAIDER